MVSTLGIDIGGANLKVADGERYTRNQPFALWQRPRDLTKQLVRLLEEAPACERMAITMTGELADCYRTKREGVEQILAAAQQAAGHRELLVYALPGRWLDYEQARDEPLAVAAANWHALSAAAIQWADVSAGIVLDIGSTTADIIPFAERRITAQGATDSERLLWGELVYTGARRSPVCAVTTALPWRGQLCPVAQELFATTLDAYLMTGDIAEDEHDLQTADNRPATRDCAHDRLARCICADREVFCVEDAMAAAEAIQTAQLARLGIALRQVMRRLPAPPTHWVISGSGEFLARRVVERMRPEATIRSWNESLGSNVSSVAAAWALARLAREVHG